MAGRPLVVYRYDMMAHIGVTEEFLKKTTVRHV